MDVIESTWISVLLSHWAPTYTAHFPVAATIVSKTVPLGWNVPVCQMSYADKSVYVGELLNFSRQGQGTLTKHSGEYIAGVWSDNVNVEDATRTDSQGIYWEGSLQNSKPEGVMHVRLPNGQEYDGVWESGDMMRFLSVYNREREPLPYIVN